jgi:gas vesicle protein
MSKGKGKVAKGFFLGAIGGAIAGLLFAPKSGKETRDDIKKGARKVEQTGRKAVKEARQGVREVEKKARNAVAGAKSGYRKKV